MVDTYTTSQGDMWDTIAKTLYGNELNMNLLIAANPGHNTTVFFSGGIVLTVPAAPVAVQTNPLPPWKL
jgi:phage tail protein X